MAMTVKSGRWSDPTVWGGAVPGAGAMAHIQAGHEIIYDVSSNAILADVLSEIGSRLTWDATKETKLRANTIMLNGITELVDNAESAAPGKPKHDIIFHPMASKAPGAGMGLGAVFTGPTRIRGFAKKGHLRTTGLSIAAGAQTIPLSGLAASGWRQGDVLVILGTEYLNTVSSDPQYSGPPQYYGLNKGSLTTVRMNEFQFGQDEERTIQSIDLAAGTVTLNAPLTYAHTGMTGTLKSGKVVTIRPVIANVSRSIRFRTATAAEDGALDPYADITVLQKRAHLMFMRQPDVDLRYFETKNMGRTSTDPSLYVDGLPYQVDGRTIEKLRESSGGALLENPLNVRGRYSIHLHWCGGPYNEAPLVPLIGATAWAPIGGYPIPGWAITHHSTRAAIEDCVVSNVRGAGMVSEVGNETGQWVGNVVTGCRGDGGSNDLISRPEVYDNHNGSSGIAYENQSRAVILRGNIAGSSKYGYVWHHQHSNTRLRYLRDADLRLVDGFAKGTAWSQIDHAEGIASETVQIPPFYDNICMAVASGFFVRHRAGQGYNKDHIPMLIRDFHCLNVPTPWSVPEYSHTYYTKDCLWQGPANRTNSKAVLLGNVTWGWMFSNIHLRNYDEAFADNGGGLNYDGFFIDITTENVANFSKPPYRTFTGARTHATKNVMGGWEDHPTDANQAIIRRYANLNSSALPSPYPLAPYGRKLPAGHPAVPIGGKPYFVLGDGTNGAASTNPVPMSFTLVAGSGENQGKFYGIIRDCVGDRRYPDWQSSETYPQQVYVKTARDMAKMLPEQLVERWGCWNDSGTWKTRVWFLNADRFTHVKFSFHLDYILQGFTPEFLAMHDLGGPGAEPEWPEALEAVPAVQRPLTPITRSLRFLSRSRLEVVAGQPLSHRLRVNEILTKREIVPGGSASEFRIQGQDLQWASGTRTAGNIYPVTIRATDSWGNVVTQAHQVIVVPSARVSATISDNFDRADENLEARSGYLRLAGDPGAMAVRGNRLALTTASNGVVYDLGSLGTSEQEVSARFSGGGANCVVMRMVDQNNWIGFARNDGGGNNLELIMCVNGTETKLAHFLNLGTLLIAVKCFGQKVIVTAKGNYEPKIMFPRSNFASQLKVLGLEDAPGTLLLPANAPLGTNVGLVKRGTTAVNPWLDDFSARALPS